MIPQPDEPKKGSTNQLKVVLSFEFFNAAAECPSLWAGDEMKGLFSMFSKACQRTWQQVIETSGKAWGGKVGFRFNWVPGHRPVSASPRTFTRFVTFGKCVFPLRRESSVAGRTNAFYVIRLDARTFSLQNCDMPRAPIQPLRTASAVRGPRARKLRASAARVTASASLQKLGAMRVAGEGTALILRLPAPCHVAAQGLPASARLLGSAPLSGCAALRAPRFAQARASAAASPRWPCAIPPPLLCSSHGARSVGLPFGPARALRSPSRRERVLRAMSCCAHAVRELGAPRIVAASRLASLARAASGFG